MTTVQLIVTIVAGLGAVAALYGMYGAPGGKRALKAIDPDFEWPDMCFHYDGLRLRRTFERLGDEGRRLLRHLWLTDYGFIACLLIVMLAVGRNVAGGTVFETILLIAAITRAALDALENALLLACCRKHPAFSDRLAGFAGWVTSTKFVAMGVWVATLFARLMLRAFGMFA